MYCPFPVFYFVLLGVGFGVPSFAHNDHLAQFIKYKDYDKTDSYIAFETAAVAALYNETGYTPISVVNADATEIKLRPYIYYATNGWTLGVTNTSNSSIASANHKYRVYFVKTDLLSAIT